MKKIRLILCISALFFFATSYGQNEKTKANLIFNIARLTEWPIAQRSGDFVIGVYGNGILVNELNICVTGKKIGLQKILIRSFKFISEISRCHVLIIDGSKSGQLGQILTFVCQANTLVITDYPGFARKGAGINFLMKGTNQTYEVNKADIQKQGLTADPHLLS